MTNPIVLKELYTFPEYFFLPQGEEKAEDKLGAAYLLV